MNKVILMGRLTRDPEIQYSGAENQQLVAHYTLAVNRSYSKNGDDTADFINCVAFGKSGEFAQTYLKKGTKIVVVGQIRTGSYISKKTNQKVYTTDIVVSEHEFCQPKKPLNSVYGRQDNTQHDAYLEPR